MTKIDQDALITMFSQASAKQGEALRKAFSEATLKALQGRELTLKNIKGVVKTMTEAASAGAAKNIQPPLDVEDLLGKAFAGMDAALLKAVEANKKALQQFVDQGVNLQETQMKNALSDLEKMEDAFFASVTKAATAAGDQAPWGKVLESMKIKGSETGAGANAAVEQLMGKAQSAVRDSRAAGLKATQALLESYSALVSGVLIGMSEGLQQSGSAPEKTAARKKAG